MGDDEQQRADADLAVELQQGVLAERAGCALVRVTSASSNAMSEDRCSRARRQAPTTKYGESAGAMNTAPITSGDSTREV